MKKGLCLTAIFPEAMYSCEELMKKIERTARETDYKCLEFYFEGNQEEEDEVRELLKKYQLSCVFLAGFPLKKEKFSISARDEAVRMAAVQKCRKLYESAVRIGAEKMLILSGPVWEDHDRAGVIRQTQKSLCEMDEWAKKQKTEITLEFFPVKREPWLAVGDTELVYEIYKNLDLQNTGITLDTSHVAQLGEHVMESLLRLQPWVHHLHLANSMSKDKQSPLYGDRHPLFGLKQGDFALEEIREIFQQIRKTQSGNQIDICSMEIISRGDEETYFTETLKETNYIWSEDEL